MFRLELYIISHFSRYVSTFTTFKCMYFIYAYKCSHLLLSFSVIVRFAYAMSDEQCCMRFSEQVLI